MAGAKRQPSSFVHATTSTGRRVVWLASLRVRMTSSPASTP